MVSSRITAEWATTFDNRAQEIIFPIREPEDLVDADSLRWLEPPGRLRRIVLGPLHGMVRG